MSEQPTTPSGNERLDEQQSAKCEHDWKYEDDEYGSLASGGSYEIYRCTKCGKRDYVQLPD